MAWDTRLPDGDRDAGHAAVGASVWARLWTHMARIRYRLLLINVLVVAVPITGIGFARTFEREMLASLENDMIHQAQVIREVVRHDPAGLRLEGRSAMLESAARHTRTRIRLLDDAGRVLSDSHGQGPPEGAEKPTPQLFGLTDDEYHPPEQPRKIDVSIRREVQAALQGQYGSATRMWQNRQRVYLFSALPISRIEGQAEVRSEVPEALASEPDPGESGLRQRAPSRGERPARSPPGPGVIEPSDVLGVVYVTRSTAPVKFAMFRLRTWLVVVLVIALAVTAILSLFLAATISRPLGRLTRVAQRIASGDRRDRVVFSEDGEATTTDSFPVSRRRDEIGQLARAFQSMTRRLDERARYTGELAANISHEFKSPLTSIRGAAELLRDGAVDDVPARDKFLGNIIEDSHRLDRLVTRLLELSRLEADDAPLEYIDYEALVREVVDQKREMLAGSGDVYDDAGRPPLIEVSYRSKTTQLQARRHHLASVLSNLLDNAIQHADPGSDIMVRVTDGPASGLRTSVTNHGPVISEASLARIWDRFFTTRAKHGGTGLGLAIVSSMVRSHGGRTTVTSSAQDGTTFSFDLPAR